MSFSRNFMSNILLITIVLVFSCFGLSLGQDFSGECYICKNPADCNEGLQFVQCGPAYKGCYNGIINGQEIKGCAFEDKTGCDGTPENYVCYCQSRTCNEGHPTFTPKDQDFSGECYICKNPADCDEGLQLVDCGPAYKGCYNGVINGQEIKGCALEDKTGCDGTPESFVCYCQRHICNEGHPTYTPPAPL